MDIQVAASQYLSQIAAVLPFGYAFGAGMVSAVNPCGFFLLPVYMTLYLGAEESDYQAHPLLHRLLKAVWVAVVVTVGFGLLFGLMGGIISAGGYVLMGVVPWFGVVVGFVFIVLGTWLLMGNSLSLPHLSRFSERVGDLRRISVWGFFMFGAALAATSLGCTIPIFLAVIGANVAAGNLAAGFLQGISFVLGLGFVLQLLTLGIAVVKKQLVISVMQRVTPHVHKLSAIFLLIAGGYIINYWYSSGLLFPS